MNSAGSLNPNSGLFAYAVTNTCNNPNPRPVPGTVVELGSTGTHVRWIQYELDHHNRANLVVDGFAGNATIGAIINFQETYGLLADGIAGNATVNKIDSLWHGPSGTNSPTTPAPIPPSSSATMARSILNSSVQLATTHASGKVDKANAWQNIVDVSMGKQATRSNYSDPPSAAKAPGGTTPIDPRVLNAILKLNDKYKSIGKPSVWISEVAGGCHSKNSKHYDGKALDIIALGGIRVSTATMSQKFMADFRAYAFNTLGASLIYDPYNNDPGKTHNRHIHIDWRGDAPANSNYSSIPTPAPSKPAAPVVTVVGTSLVSAKIAVSARVWTGRAIAPQNISFNGKNLAANKDYTIKSVTNNKAVGKATMKIEGRGGYRGPATVSFRIVPRPMSLSSLAPASKQLLVKWPQASTAQKLSGVQIRYRQTGNTRWATLKFGAKVTAARIANLPKDKKYDVQIRGFRTVSGKIYAGAWSKTLKSKAIK